MDSAHEVYIDDEQLEWFKGVLRNAGQRPIVVFSHAPPQGCGLTVVQVRLAICNTNLVIGRASGASWL